MRKIILSIFLLFILVLVGCKEQNESTHLFEYKEPTLIKNTSIEIDSNMAIDASDSEDVYKDMETISFVETSSGNTCTAKAYLGEKGIYLYAYVLDKNVYVSSEKEFFQNDSVEFYIDPNPDYSLSLEALNNELKVRTDCVQLRINALGEHQTWYGRTIGEVGSYPWASGYFDALATAHVDGKINEKNGAKGYSVEAFIPYSEMKLEAKPEKIGVLVAFNNVNNREDTSRTWFSYKGMSHQKLTSYTPVTSDGFQVSNYSSERELNAFYYDYFYQDANEIVMYQVDENNENPEERAKFKFVLGEDGVYLTALVKDRVYSYVSDGIFSNDGIEILIDTRDSINYSIFEEGVYRFSYDIAGGCQTDICMSGHNDYVSVFNPTLLEVKVESIDEESLYNYKYEYTYEAMIPYEVLGLEETPEYLKFAFAVKTPNEKAYIQNRKDREGNLEGQDWLWVDKHYPQNPSEYFILTEHGSYAGTYDDFEFNWEPWPNLEINSASPERYNVRGYVQDDGLYFNMVQYVDNYFVDGVSGDWLSSTHIEAEVWHHNIGYGWDGTYFAFFPDGTYYVNNDKNIKDIINKVTIKETKKGDFKYEISYEVFVEFDNNLENPNDGPYSYVKFMSHTPGEDNTGYENSILITKDSERFLWTDDCDSYAFNEESIYMIDKPNKATAELVDTEVVSGSFKELENKLISTSSDSLALLKDLTINDNMSVSLKVIANSFNPTGIVFAYDGNSYYYFCVDGSSDIKLYKVLNNEYELLYSNYISASYKYNKAFDMTVEFKDGKYYCSFFNTLHVLGDLELTGTKIGFASSLPGGQFYDVKITDSVSDKDVNTLIIGHSYTELWTNYQSDFASIGLGENILNIGISGSHSMHWNELENSILEYSPELLIYNIGINDLFFNSATPKEISDNIKDLLVNLKANKSDLEVVLISLNHCVTSGHISQQIIETNQYLKQLSNEYDWISYVDIENSFLDDNGQAIASLFTDGLHPTEYAYKNVIIPEIFKGLGKLEDLVLSVKETQKTIDLDFESTYTFEYETNKDTEIKITCDVSDGFNLDDNKVTFSKTGAYKFTITALSGSESVSIDVLIEVIENEFVERNWDDYITDVKTDAPNRYQIISHTASDGLYIKIEQYVDNYIIKTNPSDWNSTHVEMQLWNHSIGYGWDGTYFAFFADGSFYINNWTNCNAVYNLVKISENPTNSTYKYTISYNIYIGFANNLENPNDGPYAFCKFMFVTPGEDITGYKKAEKIIKEERELWTDRCSSYEIHNEGITRKVDDRSIYDATDYKTVETDAPDRYEFYSYASNDGILINVVQYVDNYSVGSNWLNDTHIEFELWNHSVGYGWDGTYFAFFMDGSYYVNNDTNIKDIVNLVFIEEVGENYKYKIIYQIFINFDNNLENPEDGPYGYIQFMSYTPYEGVSGYENAAMIRKDDRVLWTDHCSSYEIHNEGVTRKDGVKEAYDATLYETVGTDAPSRYEIYGYASNDGIVINAIQYVDNYSVGSDWLNDTHVEVELFNHSIGYGWDGTYFAFFMDGTYSVNNDTNIKNIVNRVTIVESSGVYNYQITYQIFINFDNNLENPEDGPYCYVHFMSYTPGENKTGYDNALEIIRDGNRTLWKDTCQSYRFANLGVVERMEKITKTNITDIGDPMILLEENTYYMYATCDGGRPFHVYTSLDCKNFEDKGVCLSEKDTFAYADIWAPEVFKYNDLYYMVYSGRSKSDELMHVQIAVANSPLGPFKDIVKDPILQIPGLSTIDGHVYIENDEKYLFYSLDCSTNIINGVHTSQIYCIKLADDFKSVVGEPVFISTPTSDFEKLSGDEWQWNEGPFVIKHNNKYYMTCSTNCYNTLYYSVVCYVSDSIMGPYVKQEEQPVMSYIENVISGPGHNAFFTDKNGKLKCVFHIHTNYDAPSGIRTACICDAYFDENGKLVIDYK